MKQTRTTLKELTAAYRAVLRHGILCNAIALGLIATAPAMAAEVSDYAGFKTALSNDTNIVLSGDVSGDTGASVPAKSVSVDLGGHTLTIDGATTAPSNSTFIVNGTSGDSSLNISNGSMILSNNSAQKGAFQISSRNGHSSTLNANLTKLEITGNTGTGMAGGIYHENIGSGESTITANEIKIADNTAEKNNGAAILNVTGKLSVFGETNTFSGNKRILEGEDSAGLYKRGGGAISNQAGEDGNGTKYNSVLVIGKENGSSTNTFANNTSSTNGGAILNRSVNTDGNAILTINGITTFENNTAALSGGAIYNVARDDEAPGHIAQVDLTNGTYTFTGNTAKNGGAVYNEGKMTLTNATFGGENEGDGNNATFGGAVYNLGTLSVGGEFSTNTAKSQGGAIYNNGTLMIADASFTGNVATNDSGGAIRNNASGTMSVENAEFTNNITKSYGGAIHNLSTAAETKISDSSFSGNYAGSGGAIYNASGAGKLVLENTTISGNGIKTTNSGQSYASNGGAIYNNSGTLEISGGSITDNMANKAGAIYVASGSLSIDGTEITGNASTGGSGVIWVNGGNGFTINNATIDNNSGIKNDAPIYVVEGLGLVPAGTGATGNGGAIYNSTSGKTSTITGGSISQNVAATGGAIYNNKGTLNIDGTTFNGNVASGVSKTSSVIGGGAIRNLDTLNIKDATFTNNIAKEKGGAIFNAASNTITFDGSNTFSGNKSDVTWDEENGNITASTANDIYNNMGTIYIISGAGETNTFAGGFDGVAGSKLYINGAGTTNIANTLKKHTVDVNSGELHLTNADLTGSTINVALGATINTIDNLVNDYTGAITLADGAGVKGDIDYTAGLADKYSADSGANITYKLANALNLSGVQYGSKEIAITNTGATVNKDVNFAWFNGDTGLTLTTGGTGTGTVLVSGVAGGINAAVDATDDTVQEVNYALNGNDTFTGTTDNVIQKADFTITGNGNDAGASDKIVFGGENMVVDGNSTLTLNDVVLEKTGDQSIVNQLGATLNINDSRIAVNVNNYGTLVSDPTYYDAKVVNAGTATFTDDVFENGSSLTNSATVNLNNVEFVSGSTLTGLAGNVLNVAGTGNKFNGTSTGNNVVLASGADFVGTLSDGSVDARNGGIDTITGSVSGGDLYVDANLNAGTVDTFGGTTGATVKGIKLAGTAYGDDDKVELTIGDAALDSNLEIDGTNYFTSVAKDGDKIVFSDKLINESNLYSKLGSWSGGKYIKSNVDMDNAADASHLTVGSALSALDTAIGDMSGFGSQNYATNTGSVAANITALDSQLKTVSTEGTIASGNTGFVSGGAVYTALADKVDTTRTINGHALNADVTLAASDVLNTDQLAAANSGITAAKVADYDTAVSAVNNATTGLAATNTLANQNKTDIATLKGTGDGSVSKSISDAITALDLANTYDAKGAASAAETAAKGYADGLDTAIRTDFAAADTTTLNTAKTYTDNKVAAALTTVSDSVTAAWNNAEAWMNTALGIDSTANDADDALQAALGTTNYLGGDTSFSGALKTLDGQAKTNADAIATNATNIAANKDAIDVLNGDASTVGSVDYKIAGALSTVEAGVTAVYTQAHDWAENLLGVDVDENVNNQLQNALTSKEVIGSTTTIAGALSNLDAGVDALQNVVGDAQTTAATTGILNGIKIGADKTLVEAVDMIATAAAGTDADNTFTGTNTFEKQIVAEKGVKFGSDYSIDENGAATLASVTAANGFTVDANNTLTSTGLTAAAATIAGNATVGGATTLTGLLTANGGISTTDITASGDVSVGGNFAVTGATTLTGALNGSTATFTGAVSADSLSATNGVSGKTLTATDSITLGSSTITSIDTAGLARNVAGSDSALATTSSVVATIKNHAEDATYTNTITSGSNVSGATLNAAIANLDATIGDMSGLNARDDANSVGNALANGGTTTPTTVVAALNNIDATLGTIHGLKTKLESAGTYKGNLATGTTVEEHLTAIDSAIGDRSSLASLNTAINNAAKTDVATALETTGNLIGNMTFDGTNYLASVTDLSEAVRVLDSNIAKVDHKVEKLEKKVNSGMASMAALTALVPNARDCGDTQISIGTGAYADRAGVAVGAFHYFNDHVLLNAGASYGGTSDWAFRAGITFGL